jgi:Ca-activated chloride channel family protein
VLDFSNSMWGQVDEVAKIEIAREVFADMLQTWDPSRQLGVVA